VSVSRPVSHPVRLQIDTNKRAKIQIIFEIFQAEVSSTLVKYTKKNITSKQNAREIAQLLRKQQTPRKRLNLFRGVWQL